MLRVVSTIWLATCAVWGWSDIIYRVWKWENRKTERKRLARLDRSSSGE